MKRPTRLFVFLLVFAATRGFALTAMVDGITWTYTVSGGKATVGGGSYSFPAISKTTVGDVEIPAIFGEYPVSSIGSYAFRGCSGLTSITIPDSVTSIGSSAFSGCSGLTSITIPDSVTTIGSSAFSGCIGLTEAIFNPSKTVLWCVPTSFHGFFVIPDNVTTIGSYAFFDCSSLTSVSIPDSVTRIGCSAFSGCSKLSDVSLPETVAVIDGSAFEACSQLTTIRIPGSVLALGSDVFTECSTLESVLLPRHFQTNTFSLTLPETSQTIFYDASTLTSPVPVAYSWLDDFPALLAANGNDYEKAALSIAANGINQVWECYLAGLDPMRVDSKFQIDIQISNGKPVLSWTPNLEMARTYRLEGKQFLSDTTWNDALTDNDRFFEYWFVLLAQRISFTLISCYPLRLYCSFNA